MLDTVPHHNVRVIPDIIAIQILGGVGARGEGVCLTVIIIPKSENTINMVLDRRMIGKSVAIEIISETGNGLAPTTPDAWGESRITIWQKLGNTGCSGRTHSYIRGDTPSSPLVVDFLFMIPKVAAKSLTLTITVAVGGSWRKRVW